MTTAPTGASRAVPALVMSVVFFPAMLLTAWLTCQAAAFMNISPGPEGLLASWDFYPCRVSVGLLAPPLLVAGLGHGSDVRTRFVEAARAALVVFLFYCLVFFLLAGVLRHYMPGLADILLPRVLAHSGPTIMLLLMLASYQLALALLPQLAPTGPRPASMNAFGFLLAMLLVLFVLMAYGAMGDIPLPALEDYLANALLRPQFLLLFLAVGWSLVRGRGMFRPVFLALCLAGPLFQLLDLPLYPPVWRLLLIVHAIVATVAVGCLYMPASQKWFGRQLV